MNNPPTNPHAPADKTYVVVQDGRRVTGALSEQEAQNEAARRTQMLEAQNRGTAPKPNVRVVQNLHG